MIKSVRNASTKRTPPWKRHLATIETPYGSLGFGLGCYEDGERFLPHLAVMRHPDTAMCDQPCRLRGGAQGTIVPCRPEDDEKILLVAAATANGLAVKAEAHGIELLGSSVEPNGAVYIAARVTEADGHVAIREGNGAIDVYSWKSGHMRLPEGAYDRALAEGALFQINDWEDLDLVTCAEKRAAWEAGRAKSDVAQ